MINPEFMKTLRTGRKPIDWLDISMTGKHFSYSQPLQQHVEKKREELYTREKSLGKKIWDSDMYRVDDMIIKDDACVINLGIMKRSLFFTVKFCQELFLDISAKDFPNGISCAALVETVDKKFVFGVRNMKSAGRTGGEKALIGGTLEPDEGVVTSYQGFYDHICRELQEEIGVRTSAISQTRIVGILRMKNGGYGFIYYIQLTSTAQEVKHIFPTRTDDEMSDMYVVDRTEVIDFLHDDCYEHGVLTKQMGLCVDYLREIFAHTE